MPVSLWPQRSENRHGPADIWCPYNGEAPRGLRERGWTLRPLEIPKTPRASWWACLPGDGRQDKRHTKLPRGWELAAADVSALRPGAKRQAIVRQHFRGGLAERKADEGSFPGGGGKCGAGALRGVPARMGSRARSSGEGKSFPYHHKQ